MLNKNPRRWVGVALLAVLLAGCGNEQSAGGGAASDQGKIVVTGSSTIAPILGEIGKRYESENPGVRVNVQTGGSSRGIADAHTGIADIGTSSRALTDKESEGVTTHILARDGVCFIVHQDNPVETLSNAQLRAIYTGEIDNWNEVGGRQAPITVVNRADGRSELELFKDYFDVSAKAFDVDLIVGENEQGIKTIAGNPDAITYMSIGTSEYDLALGVPIKLLPLDGVAASTKTVASGAFPLGRPLLMITRPEPKALVAAFIAYAQSDKVHDIIRDQSFVPVE